MAKGTARSVGINRQVELTYEYYIAKYDKKRLLT